MSRRRRHKRPVESQEPVKKESTLANDGFVNSLAYLGEASTLNKANDYERHPISNEYDLLTTLYRENWLAARIIDTPCEDMTRAWYSISSEIDQEKLDELAKLEAKHNVKQEITNAIRWGRLYGGAAAVMVIKGQEDMLDQPLDYDMLQPGCFRGLIVIDKVKGIFPSIELEDDMDDVEFGYPKWYEVILDEESSQIIRIHHSRLLLFRGRQLPIEEEIAQDYWGASELEHVYEELQKRNATSANIAQLVFQANVAALKIADYGEVLGMGSEAQKQQVYRTIQEANRIRTSFGMMLMGTEDAYEQHPYTFAGVAEVYETFMMDMAGAAEIPATKLFGRAPQGMNATGESDMKNYYEMINQLQERHLKPALEKLIPVMAMSLWGEVPEDFEIVFEPLGSTTPAERAEIMGQMANPIVQAFSAGIITQRMALQELRETGKPIGAWTNISDEDIEKASDEFETAEAMDPMSAMMGGGGMPPEGQVPPEQMMQEAPPEEMQPDVDMDRVHELKERIQGMKAQEEDEANAQRAHELKERLNRIRETQAELESDEEETQAEPETTAQKAHRLKARLNRIREAQAQPDEDRIARLRERIERIRQMSETEEAEDAVGESSGEMFDPNAQPDPQFEAQHPRGPGGQFASKGMTGQGHSTAPQPKSHTTAAGRAWNVKHGFPETANVANKATYQQRAKLAPKKVTPSVARATQKVRKQVAAAAQKGDFKGAKAIMKNYQQRPVRRSVLGDALAFIRKMFDREFREEDHPRDESGKFTSGGGSPIDNGTQEAYNGKATKGWKGLNAAMKVGGPRGARAYIRDYFAKHPDVAQKATQFKDARQKVANFLKDHPDAENFNTYDPNTGKVKEINSGYCVTFHQNLSQDDALGGYTDEDYANLCAIAAHELGANGYNIGYFGNPEISFECQDEQAAKRFAVEHNQHSVYNAATGRTLKNKQYRKDLNPIKL